MTTPQEQAAAAGDCRACLAVIQQMAKEAGES